ncbi:para-nitrobenzyl esterase [Frigoribacterium sp. PhB160]|uniref:carboxylesterase family protein n=1 Tax=Frigoribacterium sp. PhB160 TaxID=2485192 RepID=UPI000FB97032|nr:carboxylesterase family protein [Frigoribacterium sp. PhB160]ROS58281.1 para-nitrobenzyl esterase [Frigoribacterium sp. PhB160]
MSTVPETRTPPQQPEQPVTTTPRASWGADAFGADGRPRRTRTFSTGVGEIVGFVDDDVVRVLGVPYAVAERHRAPQPAPPAVDDDGQPVAFEAFTRSPASPQLPSPVLEALIQGASDGMIASEHCQFLSITLPADVGPDERLPVMVWIHGGSYVTGAGDLHVYDPVTLVTEQRVVVVTVTYRLGMFGYLGDGDVVPANLGLLDQVQAVRWVHDQIEAFGGAADSVTLFGQSAGGDAIAHLMISEGARGTFRRAIVQSAPLGLMRGRSRMTSAMVAAVGAAGADDPVDDLLARQATAERAAVRYGLRGGMAFGAQYGRAPLPAEDEREAAWSAVAPEVDVLIGTTTEETGLYVPFVGALRRLTGLPLVGRALRRALVRVTTDAVYTRDARRFVARHRAAGGRATRYEITWRPPGSDYGASHITDVPLLLGGREAWGGSALLGDAGWDEVDRRGRRLRQVWGDFARTGTLAGDAAAGLGDTLRLFRD